MITTSASLVVSVRFHKTGKLYHFDASAHPELVAGDYVIVDTTRGRQIGQIMGIVPPDKAEKAGIKPIKAPATARDLMMKKWWEAKELEALIHCRATLAEMGGLEGVKFVRASYNYDGSMLVLIFTSEEETVNTNRLRKRLEQDLHTRIEMRQIGARDAARLLGEYGACSGLRWRNAPDRFQPGIVKIKAHASHSIVEIWHVWPVTLLLLRVRAVCEALRAARVGKWIGTPFGEQVVESNLLEGLSLYVEDTRKSSRKTSPVEGCALCR
jgi:cell fate regulator YaaT (PSP1 superfamily)